MPKLMLTYKICRLTKGVFVINSFFWVVGTDTDVGKTFVTTTIMSYLQKKKKSVIPYKPIQTGVIDCANSDSSFYQKYSDVPLNEEHINSYSYKKPASPHYAARLEGEVINEQHIVKHIEKLKTLYDFVICEGAGGLYVPINEYRGTFLIDIIKQSKLPVLLVASTKLGTINHTMLSIESLNTYNIPLIGIVLNGNEGTELERDTIETIKNLTNIPTIVLPKANSLVDLSSESSELYERLIGIES